MFSLHVIIENPEMRYINYICPLGHKETLAHGIEYIRVSDR